jgi:NADPH-dependent ferric siderophore reductase
MSGMKPTVPKRPGRSSGIAGSDECDMRFRIDLMGVRAQVAATVRAGDTLDVAIVREGELRAVVCQTERGDRVGSVSAFPGLARLIACMEAGVRFSALVEKSSERSCSVLVMRVAQ